LAIGRKKNVNPESLKHHLHRNPVISPDFSDMKLSPNDWPCSKIVQYKFLAAKPYGVILSGLSKDRKLNKYSVTYEIFGKMKGKWAIFKYPKGVVGSPHIPVRILTNHTVQHKWQRVLKY
jgi:hypothetical protein